MKYHYKVESWLRGYLKLLTNQIKQSMGRLLVFFIVFAMLGLFCVSLMANDDSGDVGLFRTRISAIIDNSPLTNVQRKKAFVNIDTWLATCNSHETEAFIKWVDKSDLKVIAKVAAKSALVCDTRVPIAQDPETVGQKTLLSLPVRDIWHVVQGNSGIVSHINGNNGQYAWDFVVHSKGLQTQSDSMLNESHHCWGQPILSPADGIVVQIVDDLDDHLPYMIDPPSKGNYVYVDHQNGEISLLYHLMKGSIKVRLGQQIQRGNQVGLCGNTGISMFPHLHYQLFQGTLKHHERIPTRFFGFYSWTGSKEENNIRSRMRLNLSGVPKRLNYVVNINDLIDMDI